MSERNELLAYLKGIVQNLPETPGCYQYLDDSGRIIYVGKAKNLKRRVSSYFNKEQQTQKTRLLVAHIRDIRYVVVKTDGKLWRLACVYIIRSGEAAAWRSLIGP